MTSIEGLETVEACEGLLGNEVTQDDWDKLLEGLGWEGGDMGALLKQRGFANVIRGVKLSRRAGLHYVRFSNCHFVECNFEGGNFSKGAFENVSFSNCNFEGAVFFGVKANSVAFNNCRLSYTCWNQAEVEGMRISGALEQELGGMTFLGARISGQSSIENCSLKNIVFSGNRGSFSFENCTPHEIDRPVIGVGMDLFYPAHHAKAAARAVRQLGGIPVYYMHYPKEMDANNLRKATCKALADYEPGIKSRGQWILDNPHGELVIERVKNYAKEFFSAVDGLIIPGGADVPALLYKEVAVPRFTRERELLRSIIEFALLELSEQSQKPVLGICRGCQIMNVFLNGTLADFSEKTGPLELDRSIQDKMKDYQRCLPCKKFLDKITAAEKLHALSLHNQAAEKLGETVAPLLWAENVMKFSLAKSGLFIMSQVHPEVLAGKEASSMSERKASLMQLKEDIVSLEGGYDPLKVDITRKYLKIVIANYFYVGLEHEGQCFLERLQRSNRQAYNYIFNNKQRICDEVDFLLGRHQQKERELELMIKFGSDVFELFFDHVRLHLLQEKTLLHQSA